MARGLADFSPSELRAHRMNLYARGDARAMTAEELARKAGTTKAQILAYENGHRVPDPQRIRALARALELHPWYLMNPDRRDEWAVADVRRACGLRAEDVVRQLGISPKNYRRFETEGIVPSRRPGFLTEVATVFGTPREILERAIDKAPAAKLRQRRTADLVQKLAERYVPAAGPWKGPDPADPDLVELAAAYGRPISRTRRVMIHELGELRQRHVRALRERVIADYDTDRERQLNAQAAFARWDELYVRELARIPVRLEQFHRTAQPSDAWQILVDLFNADAVQRADAPWAVTKLLTEDAAAVPAHLVAQQRIDDIPVCRLTPAGYSHVSVFAGLYAALYPTSRRPLKMPTRGTQRKAPVPGTTVALPGQTTEAGHPVRLVVPLPALEKLQKTGAVKPVTVELNSRLMLTLHPHSLGAALIAPPPGGDLPHQVSMLDDWYEETSVDPE
ncbi:helix-turn-helix transcriptional regulator [Streptomyces sp. NPDC050625]|uniref:helix-turn-helix transcriptional regulator n=1 Tax=Streptomyces sp. NPDC050625 TaxID=3154629 RepID=UPI003422D48C